MIRRTGLTFALACASAIGLTLPGAALGATTVGQTFVPDSSGATCVGGEWNVVPTGTESGVSYAAPTPGVLTSWSFEAQAAGGPTILTMRVYHPTGAPQEYSVVADGSDLQTIADGTGIHTFPA